ncbi:MAG TPA: ATP-dependent DNA ligase, partial [Candidatus Eisenbacteria bacterium]|nr:ATP-dependent DNA ligase [Candidatus Eisenbacteria bacterium]
MLLAELESTSRRLAATRSRTEKAALLAALLRRLLPSEIEAGVAFLSGHPRQSRLGVGGATLAALHGTPAAATATLTLEAVDALLERIASVSGKGSTSERQRLLTSLFNAATGSEQDFLARLIAGELRQGALAGIM